MSDYVFNYSQYKKSINNKTNFHFSIMFLLIILLLGLCVFLKQRKPQLDEFYFIEINNFPTYNHAQKLSQEVSQSGGAGFVYFDGSYHVLASFHSNYDDAESVLQNVKTTHPTATIFSITSNHFSHHSSLSSSQNSSVKNFLNELETYILKIEKLSIQLDLREISFDQLSISTKKHAEPIMSAYENLINVFNHNPKHNITKQYAQQAVSAISNISALDQSNVSSCLRYHLISIVVNQHQFLSSF